MENSLELTLSDQRVKLVLNSILDKLDKQPMSQRTNKVIVPVNKKNFPELFEGDEFMEVHIKKLVELNIFDFEVVQKKRFLPLVEQNAKLVFNSDQERLLREYYGREVQSNPWIEAINKYDFSFDKALKDILLRKPLTIEGKFEDEIVTRFIEWAKIPSKSKSAREESARCFWGMSKIFDTHEELRSYFNLELMPITLLIYSHNSSFDRVLFIENLETFYQACDSKNNVFADTLLIYSSGYKASAKRVRYRLGSKMFFSPECQLSDPNRLRFMSWFYKEIEDDIPVYFWGDLDYAGIHILKALQVSFPNIKAWEIGYSPMVQSVENSFGHTPKMANKEKQYKIKGSIECSYTDKVLLPLLENKNLFLDQEFVDSRELVERL